MNNNTYKNFGDINRKDYKRQDENAEIIYALDNNHMLVFKLESKGIALTKKLIESIKVVDYKNYASYIKIEKEELYNHTEFTDADFLFHDQNDCYNGGGSA